jgi:hypothetical protein
VHQENMLKCVLADFHRRIPTDGVNMPSLQCVQTHHCL